LIRHQTKVKAVEAEATRESHEEVKNNIPPFLEEFYSGQGIIMLAGGKYSDYASAGLGVLRELVVSYLSRLDGGWRKKKKKTQLVQGIGRGGDDMPADERLHGRILYGNTGISSKSTRSCYCPSNRSSF
jgi:hypothetical protein